ncbi:MAG: transposase, partial [Bacteroidales bacterium]|nr:transposase [Bacteroidales bacterium]
MELTQTQYEQIADCFPRHRGKLTYSNLHVLNAFLYIAENGCKWRALPEKYGNWHTIYYRISRWVRNGVIDKAFSKLQEKQIVRLTIEVVSMDSTSIKIHPDAAGAHKKTDLSPSVFPVEDETPKFI